METSIRRYFDELIELPPSMRSERMVGLDLPMEVIERLGAMLLFDELSTLAHEDRLARVKSLDLSEGTRVLLARMLGHVTNDPTPLRTEAVRALTSAGDGEVEFGDASLVGTVIGSFQLLELIGQGGSSAVFRAVRAAGDGSQFVALKLLRTGLYSVDAQRRFRREQAILAKLTHPNIAGFIEGGISSAGIPYIAMELVDGVAINKAAQSCAMSLEQRLRVFCVLCRAIEAAHASLIIHRDLKPSNLLVNQDGDLKVLDFGIAQLIDQESGASHTQSMALTPGYAAPEQFRPEPLTTAIDVYALGIVLTELLTGHRGGSGIRPSALLGLAANAGAPVPAGMPARAASIRRLRGDLDDIVLRAVAEEPHLRYRTAGALADDVERHLAGEPVRAHPPSRWYLARKFVRRHRIGLALTALVIVVILGSLGIVVMQARNIEREAQRANTIRDFLEDMFAPIQDGMINDKQASVRDLLATATEKLGRNVTLDGAVRIDLQLLFARLHAQMNDHPQERALLDQAASIAASTLAPNDPLRLDAEISRASALSEAGKVDEAEPLLRSLESRIAGANIIHGSALVRLYDGLAEIANTQGRHEAAIDYERKALAERIAVFGDESPKAANGYNNLATSLNYTGAHVVEVMDAYRHAYQIHVAHSGPASFFSAFSRRNLSIAEFLAGRLRAAQEDLLAIETVVQAPPNDKSDGNVLYWQGRCRLAIEIGTDEGHDACAHALRVTREVTRADNVLRIATTFQYAAQEAIDHGEWEAAGSLLQQSGALVAASGNSVLIGANLYLSGLLDMAAGDAARSAERFTDAIGNLGHYYPEHLRLNAMALRALACASNGVHPSTSCPADAYAEARRELDLQSVRWHPRLLAAHIALARIDLRNGHAADAAGRLRNAITHVSPEVDATQIHMVEARLWQIVAESAMGDCVRAKADAASIATLMAESGLNDHPALVVARSEVARGCTP